MTAVQIKGRRQVITQLIVFLACTLRRVGGRTDRVAREIDPRRSPPNDSSGEDSFINFRRARRPPVRCRGVTGNGLQREEVLVNATLDLIHRIAGKHLRVSGENLVGMPVVG